MKGGTAVKVCNGRKWPWWCSVCCCQSSQPLSMSKSESSSNMSEIGMSTSVT